MLLYGMLCNHASLQMKKGKHIIDGDPTDGTLLVAARKLGLTHMVGDKYRIIKEIPIDSERKRMSVVVEDENSMRFLITKSAPDVLLQRCSSYINKDAKQYLKDKRPTEPA